MENNAHSLVFSLQVIFIEIDAMSNQFIQKSKPKQSRKGGKNYVSPLNELVEKITFWLN